MGKPAVRDSEPAQESNETGPACVSRRQFMLVGGVGAVSVLMGELFPASVFAEEKERRGRFAAYPRKKIGRLSRLVADKPVHFQYPDDSPHSMSILVQLGRRASGGIGPAKDVVAFNSLCSHQGITLLGSYNARHKVAGPCPLHLTTYDLTRHGMVVAGHATEGLPQVVLELNGDDIHAVGILGLIYGYPSNLAFMKRK